MIRTTLALILALAAPLAVSAETLRQQDGSVSVGVPSARIGPAFGFQRQSQWCWAACIKMLLAHNGVHIDQPTIVGRSYGTDPSGRLPNWPGSFEMITRNLNYRGTDANGRPHQVTCRFYRGAPSVALLIAELQAGQPMILGYNTGQTGHAVLVTAANYVPTANGPLVRTITVRDPWRYADATAGGLRVWGARDLATRTLAYWQIRVAAGPPSQAAPAARKTAYSPRVAQMVQAYQQLWQQGEARVQRAATHRQWAAHYRQQAQPLIPYARAGHAQALAQTRQLLQAAAQQDDAAQQAAQQGAQLKQRAQQLYRQASALHAAGQ